MSAPRFFATPAALRRWFDKNHRTADELWIGFYKKASGKPSVTWSEAVDEALCVGWIDGIRKRVDDASYKIRFTRRRRGSVWSKINMEKVAALTREKRMRPAGVTAYEARLPNKAGIYSYERRPAELVEPYASMLAENRIATEFFHAQPPGYRKLATWWIVSAKRDDTRMARARALIEACAAKKRIR